MNPTPSLHPTIVPSGQNPAIHAFGEEVVFHLTGEQTGGAFTQWVETTPPGAGPPPHWHTNEDEWFFVLEGRVSFLTDGVWHEAGPGAANAGNVLLFKELLLALDILPDDVGNPLAFRDALLTADETLTGGANIALMWQAFARRGWGYSATYDGVGHEAFDLPVSRFSAWINIYPGVGNATGLTDDPDHDGASNLLEFALGTNPTVPNLGSLQYSGTFAGGGKVTATGQPATAFENTPTGIDFRALFVRRTDYAAAGLVYTAQFSPDLLSWETSADPPTVLADDGTCQIVSVPYPPNVNGKEARFFRVGVSMNP